MFRNAEKTDVLRQLSRLTGSLLHARGRAAMSVNISADGKTTAHRGREQAPKYRRRHGAGRKRCHGYGLALVALLLPGLALANTSTTPALQDHASIQTTAQAYAANYLEQQGYRYDVRALPLDRRLRLAACDIPLEAYLPPGGRIGGTSTVGVRCAGQVQWSLFVQVTARIFADVAVAARPLARGEILAATDVRLEERDITRLPGGFLTALDEVLGMKVRRPLSTGNVIARGAVEAPRLVRRGQIVTLVGGNGPVEIRATGKALSDGAAGDRVRVRNEASRRVVEGVVAEDGTVRVNP